MSNPNIDATAQSVSDKLDGQQDGQDLSYALVHMLEPSALFGLSSSYPDPEGRNHSASRLDQVTTLAKVLTRTYVASDGKTYDIWDATMTLLEAHLSGK